MFLHFITSCYSTKKRGTVKSIQIGKYTEQ
jgi:hypothetical protein